MTTVPPRSAGFFGELILKPGLFRQFDQSRGLAHRFRADIFDADFVDDFVARARRIHRGNVRRAVEETKHAVGVFVLGRECERILVRRPSGHARLQFRPQIAADVQISRARTAAQPLYRSAGGEIDAQFANIYGNRSGRLIQIRKRLSRPPRVRAS